MNRPQASILALSLLAGCASVPVASLPKLASISPQDADPAKFEVAVRVPSDFALPEGAVFLTFEFRHVEAGIVRRGTYPLQAIPTNGTGALTKYRKRGFDVFSFRLAPGDAEIISQMRTDIAEMGGGPNSRAITLSATAKPCLKQDASPFQPLLVTLFLRRDPAEEYFVLVKETSVPKNDPDGTLNRCTGGGAG